MSITVPAWFYIVMGWGALLLATAATVRICNLNAPQSVALDAGAPSAPTHAR